MLHGVLADEQDPFGRQLQDALAGAAARGALERDDGSSGPSTPPETFFAPAEAWPAPERRVFARVHGRVLDVGCGAGRHSLEAQRRGLEVVAIDVSPGAIAVCRERGVRDARLLAAADVGPSLGEFDTVLMMCGNFGLLGNRADTVSWLRSVRSVTSASACVVLDTVDPYVEGDPAELAYMERNAARGRMAGQVRIRLRYGERVTPWFDLLLVSARELAELASEGGWRVAMLADEEPPDIYAVLEKT
jgi:SAM-dependent methyltransferase